MVPVLLPPTPPRLLHPQPQPRMSQPSGLHQSGTLQQTVFRQVLQQPPRLPLPRTLWSVRQGLYLLCQGHLARS